MSKTSDDSLLAAGAGDKIVLFEMIYSSFAILTFVEKHPVMLTLFKDFWCSFLQFSYTVYMNRYYELRNLR